MKIGIVLHPFGDSSKGLEQYIFETTLSILDGQGDNQTYFVFVKGNPDVSGLPRGTHVVNLPDVFYWHVYLFLWYARCDIFIFFTEVAPLFLWKKSIVVFFDAAYYYFGSKKIFAQIQRMIHVWWRGLMLRNVRHVISISMASKLDLVDKFHVSPERVNVIYPGFKALELFEQEDDTIPVKPFFMYVGPMKERKNVLRIVEAYIVFRETTAFEHELYLVGRQSNGEYESKVLDAINKSEYKDSIILKNSVSDAQLNTFYRKAEALLYPSLLEGFGLPILEAFSLGCVVLTSSTTSTKEVAGNAGFLVNPESVSEIAQLLERIASQAYDKNSVLVEMANQCSKFSWQKSGDEWRFFFRQIT